MLGRTVPDHLAGVFPRLCQVRRSGARADISGATPRVVRAARPR
ncbi:hypothetical protein [Actinokineospora pegani]|nr:hypothetical protein [Actinokineospora pegani]